MLHDVAAAIFIAVVAIGVVTSIIWIVAVAIVGVAEPEANGETRTKAMVVATEATVMKAAAKAATVESPSGKTSAVEAAATKATAAVKAAATETTTAVDSTAPTKAAAAMTAAASARRRDLRSQRCQGCYCRQSDHELTHRHFSKFRRSQRHCSSRSQLT